MRRPVAFLLLLMAFALAPAGCGGGEQSPEAIVESWSQAINSGDNEAAAALFADGAVVIQDGQRTTLAGPEEALAFNSSLPCGGKVVEQAPDGDEVTATFTLIRRPDHMCDGTGETAVAVFHISDGEIVLWHQLPAPEPGTESA